jgi:hypothetical protein
VSSKLVKMSLPEAIVLKYYLLYCIYLMCFGKEEKILILKTRESFSKKQYDFSRRGAYSITEQSLCEVKSVFSRLSATRVGT